VRVDAEVARVTSLPAAWSDHHPTPPAFVDAVGTPEERWLPALERLPEWSPPRSGGRVVVVSPHPDDETLGVGGLLAELLTRSWSVCVVAVTDGEAAHGRQDPVAGGRLARRRRAEQERALRRLAGAGRANRVSIVRLGMPDGGVQAVRADLTAALARPLVGADWCLAPLAWDGHSDHEATGAAARDACGDRIPVGSYPIWAWHWATPCGFPLERAVRVPLSVAARDRKAGALDCFGSQYESIEGGPVVPPHVRVRFERPFEVLLP
jgi:LmbE family N-acetylglucosaminyl deacetylase